MQCYPNMLSEQLEKSLSSLYVLYGNEPFLIEESAALIREKIRNEEVDYYKINQSDNSDWLTSLKNAITQTSLWGKSQLFEIHFPTKINSGEFTELTALFEKAPLDTYLILKLGSLTRQQQQATWFTFLQQRGVIVPHWSLSPAAFAKWVSERAKMLGLSLTEHKLNQILAHTENNPLAAAQELERLSLYFLKESSDDASSQESQYEVSDLMNAALLKQSLKVLQILSFFKTTGDAPIPLILWALRTSLKGERLFKQPSLTPPPLEKALSLNLLAKLSEIDVHVKTGNELLAWQQITVLLIAFSERKTIDRIKYGI